MKRIILAIIGGGIIAAGLITTAAEAGIRWHAGIRW